jgi:hypothetical protein
MNLFLLLMVSDENNSKIGLVDIRSFEMQFLSFRYYIEIEIGRMIANLVAHVTQSIVSQKDRYSFRYGFLKCDVLKVNVYTSLTFGTKHAQHQIE